MLMLPGTSLSTELDCPKTSAETSSEGSNEEETAGILGGREAETAAGPNDKSDVLLALGVDAAAAAAASIGVLVVAPSPPVKQLLR